uniref:E2F/DP family winged-helix DNA-binding domain-containing protein n=1 Tax=Setaria digitata TaxID=48799 RepID=A0A915Q877_9BILA
MHQRPSAFGNYQHPKEDSASAFEDATRDRSQCRAPFYEQIFTESTISSNDGATQFLQGMGILRPSVQEVKPILVFQDPRHSMSQRLVFDENRPTLTTIDLNVNSHVEGPRKRKALKIRNTLSSNVQRVDESKDESDGNSSVIAIKEEQKGNENRAERNESAAEDLSTGKRATGGRQVKRSRNTLRGQCSSRGVNRSGTEITRKRKVAKHQNEDKKPGGNGGKIRGKRNDQGGQNTTSVANGNDIGGDRSEQRGSDEESVGNRDEENRNDLPCRSEGPDRNRGQNSGNRGRDQNEEAPHSGFPRKTKTLGLLCRKFFLMILQQKSDKNDKINLEAIASLMGVEKRRIYDVVNVMEALGAMEKSHKSFYTWKGLDNLPSTLHSLKVEAMNEGLYEKVVLTQHVMTQFLEVPSKSGNYNASFDGAGPSSQTPDDSNIICEGRQNSPENNGNGFVSLNQSGPKKKEGKRQRGLNSLTYLCKYFFKILIAGLDYDPEYKVSLDVASTILIKDPEIDGCKPPDRSRCRRIYDVANVLISLRLIERKMFTFGTKKIPLFVYCGPTITHGNGKFNFFQHMRSNKLSMKLRNSEEKKAYEAEERNLELFFRKHKIDEPAEKRSRIQEADSTQKDPDCGKENIPVTQIGQSVPSHGSTIIPVVRPQPQLVVQQPGITHFPLLPVQPEGFFQMPFDPNMLLLNSGSMHHSTNISQIPMQQNNFNYRDAYSLPSISPFQQPRGPMIDAAGISSATNSSANRSSIPTENNLRASLFNIDSILGVTEGTREDNQEVAEKIRFAASIIQGSDPTGQNILLQQCSSFLFNYSSRFDPNEEQSKSIHQ